MDKKFQPLVYHNLLTSYNTNKILNILRKCRCNCNVTALQTCWSQAELNSQTRGHNAYKTDEAASNFSPPLETFHHVKDPSNALHNNMGLWHLVVVGLNNIITQKTVRYSRFMHLYLKQDPQLHSHHLNYHLRLKSLL